MMLVVSIVVQDMIDGWIRVDLNCKCVVCKIKVQMIGNSLLSPNVCLYGIGILETIQNFGLYWI